VADFDPSTPSIARVYDYFLGGRDNFAADRELVARYAAALAPGSYVILTMGLAEGAAADRFFDLYSKGPAPLYKHSAADFASFFGGLTLLPPGVADARTWRPRWPKAAAAPRRDGEMIVGVARVP
jgi:hypothetical protein